MKYVIEFEDEPFTNSNGTRMYRIKGSTSVCVPSAYLNHFPKYEEGPTANDDTRMKELKKLQPGDIIIRENNLLSDGVERQLVLFRYEDGPKYQIISQITGMIIVVSADELRDSNWRKYWNDYKTKDFFYSLRENGSDSKGEKESKQHADEIRDEAAEELLNLQPGDVIYRNLKGGELQRRIVNYVFPRPGCYEFINESGWKVRCNLPNLIEEGWHKLEDELTTKEFYWKMRGGAYL